MAPGDNRLQPQCLVIISHGGNGFGAYLETGSQMELPTGALELENTNNNLGFIDTEYSRSNTNPFDDMLIAFGS